MEKRVNIKIKRNDPCPCRSGKKYKKCCMIKFANAVMPLYSSPVPPFAAKIINSPYIKVERKKK